MRSGTINDAGNDVAEPDGNDSFSSASIGSGVLASRWKDRCGVVAVADAIVVVVGVGATVIADDAELDATICGMVVVSFDTVVVGEI